MKLISLPLCFIFSLLAGVFFAIGAGITASTKAENALEWTRSCDLQVYDTYRIRTVCGDYTENLSSVNDIIVSALKINNLSVVCKGYISRGVIKSIILDCNK